MLFKFLLNIKNDIFFLSLLLTFFISFFFSIFLTVKIKNFLKKKSLKFFVKKYYFSKIEHKSSTPSMGGIAIIFSSLISVILFLEWNFISLNILFTFCAFALIGFLDDIFKIYKHSSGGVKVKTKLLMQIFVSFIICYLYFYCSNTKKVSVNSLYFFIPLYSYKMDLGSAFYKIFFILFIIGYANSTNLTDGIDELLSRLSIVTLISFLLILYILLYKIEYFHLESSSVRNLIIFTLAILASIIGFLWFNSNPAEIFMGDTGSLSIGGYIAIISLYMKCEILAILLGLIFFIESLSVILQVLYFKISKGKRIFLMSPLHHHFQKKKFSDSKIVTRFTIISCIISVSILILLAKKI
ncbi:MAG: phospho-N-acetylmuramoyl-pentapeptide-transferase [Rickettsia sp.]|nr:phospho-N-acetylmuramoyl-pentapeptide-transferase [Rickettsia sp.]